MGPAAASASIFGKFRFFCLELPGLHHLYTAKTEKMLMTNSKLT